jgi:hypothetical protein
MVADWNVTGGSVSCGRPPLTAARWLIRASVSGVVERSRVEFWIRFVTTHVAEPLSCIRTDAVVWLTFNDTPLSLAAVSNDDPHAPQMGSGCVLAIAGEDTRKNATTTRNPIRQTARFITVRCYFA